MPPPGSSRSTKPIEGTLPDELSEALASDSEPAEAFCGLTPGRRKSDVMHLSSAKKPETRRARLIKCRDKILAGKGAMER
ncbi:MAG: YdeI/OmpD-associated family protein [Acidobacteriota bacterium]